MAIKIGAPREVTASEARVALTPDSAVQLAKLGYSSIIETGAGVAAGFSDDAYRAVGVEVAPSAEALWASANVVAKVRPPEPSEVAYLSADKTLISFFYPGQNAELLELAREKGANV
ncbi:Alanine dehydrogenase/PNT, N-terminal domain, partial [Ensifer sp. YR511]